MTHTNATLLTAPIMMNYLVELPWSWNGDPSDEEGTYSSSFYAASEAEAKLACAVEMADSGEKCFDDDDGEDRQKYIDNLQAGWSSISIDKSVDLQDQLSKANEQIKKYQNQLTRLGLDDKSTDSDLENNKFFNNFTSEGDLKNRLNIALAALEKIDAMKVIKTSDVNEFSVSFINARFTASSALLKIKQHGNSLSELIASIKDQIISDVRNFLVPVCVNDFAELHNYVDANEYGGFCKKEVIDALIEKFGQRDSEGGLPQGLLNHINVIQNYVSMWLEKGSLKATFLSEMNDQDFIELSKFGAELKELKNPNSIVTPAEPARERQ